LLGPLRQVYRVVQAAPAVHGVVAPVAGLNGIRYVPEKFTYHTTGWHMMARAWSGFGANRPVAAGISAKEIVAGATARAYFVGLLPYPGKVLKRMPVGIDDVLAEIAADYRLRLADGGAEPPLRGLKLVRDHRLGAVRLAREHGGAGYTVPEFFDHLIALAAADPDLAHILRVHYALVEELQIRPQRPGADRWIAVIAEGGVFAEQSRKAVTHDYRQTAWVGTVTLEGATPGLAMERFTRDGPLALLPLPPLPGADPKTFAAARTAAPSSE